MSSSATHPPTLHLVDSNHPETEPKQGVVVSDPDHVGVPGDSSDRLQEVLPEINRLALRVGGLKRLAEIVNSLVPSSQQ